MNAQTGIVNIRGKEYQTVALRVQLFREQHPDHSLTTAVICRDDDCVVMQATIADPNGRVIANGHSEEYRKASQINRTSALENAETSAIGRALAAFGLGGTEFASANEVQNAIHQQGAGEAPSGHSQRKGAVSPAEPLSSVNEAETKPKGWREPDSMYSTPTKLHQALARLERELTGCGDTETLDCLMLTEEWGEFVKIADKHSPHYLYGGEPAPEEFVGLLTQAQRMRDEFQLAVANEMADLART